MVNLAGNIPTEAWELDLVGLVESWKHAFQSAERAKRGACSGRPSLSLFEVRGSLHRFQACLVLKQSQRFCSVLRSRHRLQRLLRDLGKRRATFAKRGLYQKRVDHQHIWTVTRLVPPLGPGV